MAAGEKTLLAGKTTGELDLATDDNLLHSPDTGGARCVWIARHGDSRIYADCDQPDANS
jgi:hypothetical protein